MTAKVWWPALRSALTGHLQDVYPEEGCGLVWRDTAGHVRFRACENVAPAHARRYAFELDPRAWIELERAGGDVVAIVHSHPDAPPTFSEADAAAAMLDRAPLWPGIEYLVVSIEGGEAREAVVHAFREGAFRVVDMLDVNADR